METIEKPEEPWRYKQQSRIDKSLCRMECAVKGHRWWQVMSIRVCGNCGQMENETTY